MFRKLALATAGCLTLLSLGAMAPSAFAVDPGCNGNNLPTAVYNDALVNRKFDLNFSPRRASTAAQVTGGAILCGTDPGAGVYYTNGTITYPNLGEKVQCARPEPAPVSRCDQNGNGTVDPDENIPEGSYSGSSVSDVYCADFLCWLAGYNQSDNVATENYVRFGGSGNSHCSTADDTVACFQAEASIAGGLANCDSDIVVTRRTPTRPYTMSIYQPTCDAVSPAYFDTIDDLVICQYAGTVGGTSCGTSGTWMQKNGNAGPYRFTLGAQMTDGSVQQAQAAGSWT